MADPEIQQRARRYGPYAALALLFVFMVWVRIRPRNRVITESDVFFIANDPWYHARIVNYAVRYFPGTPGFDPWSYFPYGTGRHSGFGGLFDQIIALAALVTGLGDPSPRHIEIVVAYAPAVFGALTLFPAYYVAKRLTDRWSALVVGLLLALVNGQFLTRTVIGAADHQSAEAFFGTLAIGGLIFAIDRAYLEQPTRADLEDRNWRVLRRPVIGGLLGGVAIASYLMMWPPGVFLVFTAGIFVAVQLIREYLHGNSTEFLTFAAAVSMLTAAVLTLAYANSYTLSATSFSLLQPLTTAGIGVGAVVMWALAERFRDAGYEQRYYPVAVVGLIAIGFAVLGVVVPEAIGKVESLVVRIYSFGLLTSPTALTVAEIAPATLGDAWGAYTLLFPMAVFGFLLLAFRVIQENRPIELFVVLWSLTIASAYFTMIRFGYYMGVTVALLAGFAIWWTVRLIDLHTIRDISDLETYQILVVLIMLIAVLPGNVIAVGGTSPPVWETADSRGGANTAWQSELNWMNANTPDVPLEYYGRFERPASGDMAYPEGTYGVMSWWDYGHWITYTGHRIPIANPFQQGPKVASAFLLAQNETRANLILQALPSIESRNEIPQMSNAELRATIESQDPQQASESTRYVVIDDQMAAGKFSPIATWTGPDPGTYFSRQEFSVAGTQAQLIGPNDQYHNTMLARLYLQDARGLSHYRLVHESGQSAIVSVARNTPAGWETTNFINRRLSADVLRAVQQRADLAFYEVRQPATVKTFERVPGATLTGQVNTTNETIVFATVELRTNRNRTFTYVQSVRTDEQGNFEMTVPYATTNTVGPSDGGTDSGVVATGKYELFVGNPFAPSARGNASVPEPAIYDGETVRVEFEPIERSPANETNSSNATNTSNGSNSSALAGPPPDHASATSSLTGPGTAAIASGANTIAAEPRRALDA